MFNLSEILRAAWAGYRRDASKGIINRHGPFNRQHFAYCLRMAWAIAKSDAGKAAAAAAERMALIREAGALNNHRALVNVDHVTFMGFLDLAECRAHVAKLKGYIAAAERPTAAKARIAAIEAELRDQQNDDFIDWNRRRDLRAELASLSA